MVVCQLLVCVVLWYSTMRLYDADERYFIPYCSTTGRGAECLDGALHVPLVSRGLTAWV